MNIKVASLKPESIIASVTKGDVTALSILGSGTLCLVHAGVSLNRNMEIFIYLRDLVLPVQGATQLISVSPRHSPVTVLPVRRQLSSSHRYLGHLSNRSDVDIHVSRVNGERRFLFVLPHHYSGTE